LKKGEATKEDLVELQNFILTDVDLYANEPTVIHPLYWNNNRWDAHPQAVEEELTRVHEETLRVAPLVPSVWNLWGLITPCPSPETQISNLCVQHQQSQSNTRSNLRARSGPSSSRKDSGDSATSTSHPQHVTWQSAIVGPAMSFLGAFFLSFIYRSMKYYEPKATGILRTSLRAAVFVMEKILPPLGSVFPPSLPHYLVRFAALAATAIAAAVLCPPLLIPLAIGFASGLVGGGFGDFLGRIVFPMEKTQGSLTSPASTEPVEWVNARDEVLEAGTTHDLPKGYFPTGLIPRLLSLLHPSRTLCLLS
jgi:hypothetical protein